MPEPDLPFTREEYAERLAKTRAAMEAAGIELLVASDPSNMAWLTGYDGWSFYVHQCVLVPPSGEPIWYGRGQDENGALRTAYMARDNVVAYPDHYVQTTERHPMEHLSCVIRERASSSPSGRPADSGRFTPTIRGRSRLIRRKGNRPAGSGPSSSRRARKGATVRSGNGRAGRQPRIPGKRSPCSRAQSIAGSYPASA